MEKSTEADALALAREFVYGEHGRIILHWIPEHAEAVIADLAALITRERAKAVEDERRRCMKLAEECGAFGIAARISRGAEVIDAEGIVARLDEAALAKARVEALEDLLKRSRFSITLQESIVTRREIEAEIAKL